MLDTVSAFSAITAVVTRRCKRHSRRLRVFASVSFCEVHSHSAVGRAWWQSDRPLSSNWLLSFNRFSHQGLPYSLNFH